MRLYCKKCSKHTANTFPKKLVLISKNKIKGKSRCAICLTEKFFIDDIKYDLESALEQHIVLSVKIIQKILEQKK